MQTLFTEKKKKKNLVCSIFQLCQLMLENHIFETVHQKPVKEEKENSRCLHFEDSNSRLYKFLEDIAKENLYSRESPDCSNCDQDDFIHDRYVSGYLMRALYY